MTISKTAMISVCIPVFNGEEHIRLSIESVLCQTEKNFELLIVDNCSSDNTLEIAASYKDPRIKIFKNTSNIGSINNFNRCIELSQGEYFVLLPHDDLLLPTALKTFSKALIADPKIGLSYSSYYIINGNGEQNGFRMVASEDKIMSSEDAIKEMIIYGSPIQCTMVRTKLFSSLGLFDQKLLIWCDSDLWCRIFLDGNKAAYFQTPQNSVRVRPDAGQFAFMKRDKKSVKILSDHLGYMPNKSFTRNNTYYLLTFKYFSTLFNRIPAASELQKLKPVSTIWIFASLIKHLVVSLKLGDWADVKHDMILLVKIMRWAGFFRTIPTLISVLLTFIRGFAKRLLA